ncbi:hypothetical protein PV761_24165 [Arthrobacter sp. CC3]
MAPSERIAYELHLAQCTRAAPWR